MRIVFSGVFLCGLAYSMLNVDKVEYITKEECLRDMSFKWTDDLNRYLEDNIDVRKRYIIQGSSVMDVMLVSFLIISIVALRSYRVFIAYSMFFGFRGLI